MFRALILLTLFSTSIYANCEANKAIVGDIFSRLKTAAIELEYASEGQYMAYTVICNDLEIDAYASGKRFFISEGLVEFFEDKDNLAAIVSHEMSHILLKHLPGFVTRSEYKKRELAADEMSIHLLNQAGYNLDIFKTALKKTFSTFPLGRRIFYFLISDHPTKRKRLRRYRKIRNQIESSEL